MNNKTPKPTIEKDGYEVIPTKELSHAIGDRNAPAFDPDLLARAEKALEDLSGEFAGWMKEETAKLAGCYQSLLAGNLPDEEAIDAFYRSAHDLRGEAATFGVPLAGDVAASICGIVEASRENNEELPVALIGHHVDAIRAIVREEPVAGNDTADELVAQLRRIGDEFLAALDERHVMPDDAELSQAS